MSDSAESAWGDPCRVCRQEGGRHWSVPHVGMAARRRADGLRLAVMICRACEVFLFDQDDMVEFWTEHAAHNIRET